MPMSSSIHHLLNAVPQARRAEAERRYAVHGPALRSCLHSLYGEMPGFEQWYGSLLATVGELHGARSAALTALDTARAAQPDWFLGQQMLGYCCYVDRFGGDLRGVARRIPHLRELGVRYLHLLPFLKMREGENDGGFAVAEPCKAFVGNRFLLAAEDTIVSVGERRRDPIEVNRNAANEHVD